MKTLRPLLALLVTSALALIIPAHPCGATSPEEDFERLAADLQQFHALGLLQGGNGEPVTFDAKTARAQGFAAESITLGQQVADETNKLINQLEEAEERGWNYPIPLDIRGQPELQRFLAEATRRFEAQAVLPEQEMEATPEEAEGIPGSHVVCGYYPNPKPPSAAPWRDYTSSNPAATLQSLGYHPTPGRAGGGWTRNQTYQPLFCGFGTFRDHARITGPTRFREQNYKRTPGGEPNPEVWRTGPWPYPDWPLYVYWWHKRCKPNCPD